MDRVTERPDRGSWLWRTGTKKNITKEGCMTAMKNKHKWIVSWIVVMALVTGMSLPAYASTPKTTPSVEVETLQAQQERLQRQQQVHAVTVERLQQHVKIAQDGTLFIQASRQVLGTMNVDSVQQIQQGLQVTNQMIRQGYLKVNRNLSLTVLPKYVANQPQMRVRGNAVEWVDLSKVGGVSALASGGVTKVEWYWWGSAVHLNNLHATQLAAGVGAVGAVLGAWIPHVIVRVIVTLFAEGLAFWITFANRNGRGIIMIFTQSGGFLGIYSQ